MDSRAPAVIAALEAAVRRICADETSTASPVPPDQDLSTSPDGWDLTSSVRSGCLQRDSSLATARQPGPPLPSLPTVSVEPLPRAPVSDRQAAPQAPLPLTSPTGAAAPAGPPECPGAAAGARNAAHGAVAAVPAASTQQRGAPVWVQLSAAFVGGMLCWGAGAALDYVEVAEASSRVRVEYPQFSESVRMAARQAPRIVDPLGGQVLDWGREPTGVPPRMFVPSRSEPVPFSYEETATLIVEHDSPEAEQPTTSPLKEQAHEQRDGVLVSHPDPADAGGTCGLDRYCGPGE